MVFAVLNLCLWILKKIWKNAYYSVSLFFPTQPHLCSSYSPPWSDVLSTLMKNLDMALNIHHLFYYSQHGSRPFSSLFIFSFCPNSLSNK